MGFSFAISFKQFRPKHKTYEGHCKSVLRGSCVLILPNPGCLVLKLPQRLENEWGHDEGIHICSDDQVIVINVGVEMGCHKTGHLDKSFENNIQGQSQLIYRVSWVLSSS